MTRPSPIIFFKQSLKSQSFYADELINIFLLRPLAAVLVWVLSPTPVTPNQVTLAAIAVGLPSAWCYAAGTRDSIAPAALLIVLKDVIDAADGQLARAKELYSRRA